MGRRVARITPKRMGAGEFKESTKLSSVSQVGVVLALSQTSHFSFCQFTPIDPVRAVADGDVNKLKIQAVLNETKLFEGDHNDWQLIHVAARAGKVEVVDYLLKNGADVNAITNKGRGWSPLQIAIDALGEEHEVCSLLRNAGGRAVAVQKDEL